MTARMGKALVARFASHITATSRQVIGEYGLDSAAFRHTPNSALYCGFDPSRFSGDMVSARTSLRDEFGWPGDSKIVLVAGRIDRSADPGDPQTHKNSSFAVSVAIAAARRDPRIHVLFAGALSPAVPELQRRIDEAGMTGRLRFAGVRRDIERLMIGSDLLLFPSRAEGLGMVAVEAQAAGLPVLASTAVPNECVVVPELVRFLGLDAGEEAWTKAVLECAYLPRHTTDANRRVAASPFAIDNSARALVALYENGELP